MTWRHVVVGLAAAFLTGIAVFAWHTARVALKDQAAAAQLAAEARQTADSLATVLRTEAGWRERQRAVADSLARLAAVRGAETSVARKAVQRVRDSLAVAQSAVDSLPRLVQLVDTLTTALASATESAASWQEAHTMAGAVIVAQRGDLARWRGIRQADSTQLVALRQQVATLGRAAPCTVLGLPCPSRGAMLAAGLILGAVVTR